MGKLHTCRARTRDLSYLQFAPRINDFRLDSKRGKISIGFDSRSMQGRVWRGADLRRGSLPRVVQCSVEMV
jgi:hypothetical protein